MGWIFIVLGVIFLALSGWMIPHGYYILSHKDPIKTEDHVGKSVAIKIDGAKGVKIENNIISGFDTGIDARNVEDFNTKNNKINK